jgi:conjugative relaxase-like TrwC/TraI family protein
VLTIATAKDAGYYESREFALDDYYGEEGRALGTWVGREAAALGLAGSTAPGDLGTLLSVRHPGDGSRLAGRTRNAGFDLTFTAPKSVSVLAAVSDASLNAAVVAAHEAGVSAGLRYLETNECFVRRGAGGAVVIGARGFVGAAFTHELSRSGDPHLHTHVVIANVVRGEDGRYSAPDMRPVFAAAKTAGTIAEAVTRQELTRTLGVEWGPVRSGTADIAGMPEDVLREFSTRRAEIAEVALDRGVTGLAAVGSIQRQTRDRKRQIDRREVVADWRARAAEHGLGVDELRALVPGRPREPAQVEADRLWTDLAGPAGLTKADSTFDRRAVIRGIAEAHPDGIDLPALEASADAFIAAHAIAVSPGGHGRPARFTAAEMLETERRLLAVADERTTWSVAASAAAAGVAHGLGDDQQHAVHHLVDGHGRVVCLEARAGRGKTTALAAVNEAYLLAGVPVAGTAWQGEAARTMQSEAGIPSETAARLLAHLRVQEPPPGAVLVVDEASTMPTRAIAELAEAMSRVDGRLILVGDRAQLPSIDAGGAFAALVDRLGAAELTENRRQLDPIQARIADLLGDGRAADALRLLDRAGGLHAHEDPDEARRMLIDDWSSAALRDPSRALMLAHDRADVDALNRAARNVLDRAGWLGPTRLVAAGREWAAGDRLICRRNDYRHEIDVRNGTRGTVEAVDPGAAALVLRTDDGRRVSLPADYLEHAHHGYAVTGHAAQGITVDRTYLLATPGRGSAEWGYVVASRHRTELQVYVAGAEPGTARQDLLLAWTRSQAKGLVIEQLERPIRERPGRGLSRDVPADLGRGWEP